MSEVLQLDDAKVELIPTGEGQLRVQVHMHSADAFVASPQWTTAYPPELVKAILKVKGPAWLCDELKRDEDAAYVENDFRHDVLGFYDPEDFSGKRILDFGCGCGASTAIISRLLPGAEVVGVELDAPSLEIAKMRAAFYGLNNTRLLLSPDSESLPADLGEFDFIFFSAVFEHLLPAERTHLLPKVWRLLRPGGVLFLNQTPHRFFPVEGHTTGLPLINYLPDGMAHLLTNNLCGRIPRGTDWPTLLRMGIRGGTVREIMGILRETEAIPHSLKPSKNGIEDHLALWERSSRARHFGAGHKLKVATLRTLRALTGITLVPNISLAIVKENKGAKLD